uniref:Odorant receptor n=1 Tax=Aulacocentrum confusum TaxID=2767324 RepID=A0A7G8Z955_9HYME|nr:olfactory receptor 36 [Aulacocentrum confusum]
MTDDTNIDLHKKTLLEASKPLRLVGIWPTNQSTSRDIRFFIVITYYSIFVFMEYCDLIAVFGNLDLMILNLLETIFHTIMLIRLYMVKFNKLVLKVIKDIAENKYDFDLSEEEKKIYTQCHTQGVSSYKIVMQSIITGVTAWYLTPVTNYVISRMKNESSVLIYPYRIPIFFNVTSFEKIVAIYICEMGINYFPVCYGGTCNMIGTAVNNVCCQLTVLTYRVENLNKFINEKHEYSIFHHFCESHLRIIQLTQNIDRAFHLAFLNELLLLTILISLIIYSIILHFDEVEIVDLISSSACALLLISIIGLNCTMSQNLIDKSTELHNAYWNAYRSDIPVSYQKLLIIPMICSQVPLYLTAGQFYIYSLPNFVNILKTSMAYASMLRTVNA